MGFRYDQMTGDVARDARVSGNLVRLYCDLGLVPFRRLPGRSTRILRSDAAQIVRQVLAKRMKKAGRPKKAASVSVEECGAGE
jgi:hypothetical protein